jgi:pimeloyl-ACP methyl ester carboxylesterase
MRGRHLFVNLFLSLCILVSVILNSRLISAQSQGKVPRYEKAACKFEVPADVPIECGFLTVLEDRNRDDSRTIRLHIAIIKTSAAKPEPDPIIFLDGGPGVYSLVDAVKTARADIFKEFAKSRDVILFDQRGLGYSEPAMNCPEQTKVAYDNIGKDIYSRTVLDQVETALDACYNRLVDENIDPTAYTTVNSAADVNDMRIAMGYKTWNLYGVSYGTRLAQSIMLHYPRTIRSVMLDSVLVGLRGYPVVDFDAAFNVLFQGCAKDTVCNENYPDLGNVFADLVKELNRNPVTVTVKHPTTGKQYAMYATGAYLEEALFDNLYSTKQIPILPRLIYEVHDGNLNAMLDTAFESIFVDDQELTSVGMSLSVRCSERAGGRSCNVWWSGPVLASGGKAVTSDLPTLVLAGRYDPVTPPHYSKPVIDTLRKSYYFEFPGIGHGVNWGGPCPIEISLAFLKNPKQKPASTCIAKMTEPKWLLPGEHIPDE